MTSRATILIAGIIAAIVIVGGLNLFPIQWPQAPRDLETPDGKKVAATLEENSQGRSQTGGTKHDAGETKANDTAREASGDAPSFDIMRVNPEGTSVFAGQAAPKETVTVLADGKPVATVKADDTGAWSVATEAKIPNPDADLTLSTDPALAAQATGPAKAEEKLAAADAKPSAGATEKRSEAVADVTSGMIKNLEGLVEEARKDAEKATTASAKPARADTGGSPAGAEKQTAEDQPQTVAAADSGTTSTPTETPAAADGATTSSTGTATTASAPSTAAGPAEASATAETATQAGQDDEVSVAANKAPSDAAAAEATTTGTPRVAGSRQKATANVPVPIMFVFREATFTPEGKRAVQLLLEYLKLKSFDKVTLTGHADERGTLELNMDLSQDRLDAVANYLRAGGFSGALDLVPKGEMEPFTGVDRTKFAKEDLYQLDRRVELRLMQ